MRLLENICNVKAKCDHDCKQLDYLNVQLSTRFTLSGTCASVKLSVCAIELSADTAESA